MNKYTATDSKGRTHKRGSKNRTYTHCVVAYNTNPNYVINGQETELPPTVSWAGTPALAEARAQTFRNYTYRADPTVSVYAHVEIVEAQKV